jgi:hypothetical protein
LSDPGMFSAIVAIWTIGDSATAVSSLLNFTTGILPFD